MKKLGLFEAKTKFSEVCDEVARTGQSVTVTRRGKPLVRIDPVEESTMTMRERRDEYMSRHAEQEQPDRKDFEPPKRSREMGRFTVEE
jgi:prevent-host-death family protein